MTTERALTTIPQRDSGIVQAAVTPEQAVERWQEYQEMKRRLLTDEDYHTYQGGRRLPKKSAWRKFATVFNLTDRVVSKDIKEDAKGRPISARYEVEVMANNGRTAVGVHGCHVNEKCCPASDGEPCGKDHEHCPPGCSGWRHWSHPDDIPATGHTRAKNRAISDLIGGGEVSAEEVDDEKPAPRSAPKQDAPKGLCPVHHEPFVHRQGTSKAGAPYDFWACPGKTGGQYCKEKPADPQPVRVQAEVVEEPDPFDGPDLAPTEDLTKRESGSPLARGSSTPMPEAAAVAPKPVPPATEAEWRAQPAAKEQQRALLDAGIKAGLSRADIGAQVNALKGVDGILRAGPASDMMRQWSADADAKDAGD